MYKGTEYGIGLFPLGGYVKLAGIIDESMDTVYTGENVFDVCLVAINKNGCTDSRSSLYDVNKAVFLEINNSL